MASLVDYSGPDELLYLAVILTVFLALQIPRR